VGNTTIDLLDEVEKHEGITDYEVAKRLGIRPQAVSHYRKGRTRLSDENAVKLCAMIGKDPQPVLALLAAERAERGKKYEVARIWRDAARRLARGKGGNVV
jgi:plasmid maintenance system antidote protein VapI